MGFRSALWTAQARHVGVGPIAAARWRCENRSTHAGERAATERPTVGFLRFRSDGWCCRSRHPAREKIILEAEVMAGDVTPRRDHSGTLAQFRLSEIGRDVRKGRRQLSQARNGGVVDIVRAP